MFWLNVAQASTFMPVQGTKIAAQVDSLYVFLLWASFISCVLVIGGFIYFAIKHRRRSDNDKTAYITHNNVLEFTWSFIPFVIFMIVFGWGWWLFHEMRSMPEEGALEVQVVGQKWDWSFIYKSGKRTIGEFYVPVNRPVKLVMTSRDVLHSLFVPAFRIKQDVIPGRYTALWFDAKKEGTFQIFCTEYCGDQHSTMLAQVHVVSEERYEQWLQDDPYRGLSLVEIGEQIFTQRCVACHTASDQRNIGPGFGGIWGVQHEMEDGEMVTVDENYIRESILQPNARITKGYPANLMPSFAGQLSEEEMMGIIEFIKSLAN